MSATPETELTFERLLKWHPPKIKTPTKGSKNTTPPSKFSQHLDDGLILQRIVRDPHMLDRLSKVADTKIAALVDQTPGGLALPRITGTEDMHTEAKVVECHDNDLSPLYCALSTQALTSSPEAVRPYECAFTWSARDSRQVKGNIPDGILRLNSDHPKVEPLKHLQSIAVWEFKRIQIMDDKLVSAIERLIEKEIFHWCRCTIVNPPNSNLKPEAKCTAKQHFTASGAYMYNLTPRGPDVFVPTGNLVRQAIGTSHLRALHITNPDDKVHHIFQQIWMNGVMDDCTYTILSTLQYDLICIRHRESQTLFVSELIITAEKDYHTKILVGLYLSAMEDAIERDDLIDRASAAESNQYRGCTPEQKEKYRNIVRHWNVPKTKTFLYPRDVKEDENDAMEELRQCDSIFLVAPLAEKQGQGRNLLLPELPYIWLRVDSRFDSDPLLSQQDVDEGEDQAEEGGSLVDGQDHSNGTIADTEDNDDNVDGLEEQTGKTDEAEALPKHAMNNGEDGGIKMSVIDVIQSVIKARYPTQDLDWLDDHPPSQPSDFTLDGHGDEPPLQEDTTFSPWKDWTMPPPDSLEVYTMTDHSQTHFAARVRYNNRFLLGERLHVRVVPVNVERMTNLKLGEAGLFREYQIMKTTQERNPDAFRVYGIFGYKHLVDANIACPDTGGSCYRLATTSRADREVVPIRYYAILTTPIGDAIDDTHEQLTIKQIQAFTNTLLDGHTEGYLHGDMNHSGQNLRILADGSTLIIGWRDGTKHDADDNTFKEGKHRELQKFGAYLTKRAAKINEAVPQSNQVKKNSKRKAKPEDRVSQDRELKKLVLLSTGDAEPEGSGLIRED